MGTNTTRSVVVAAGLLAAILGSSCSSTNEAVTATGPTIESTDDTRGQTTGTGSGSTGSTASAGTAAVGTTSTTAPPANPEAPNPAATAGPRPSAASPPGRAAEGGDDRSDQPDEPATTIPGPATSLPPSEPTTPPTIPPTAPPPAEIDCGTIYRATGWPTTPLPNPVALACLVDAFAAGTPARLVDREQTDGMGGAILVTTYEVLGPGQVRVTVDATNAADRPQVVTVSVCTGLTRQFVTIIVSGCIVIG